MTFKIETYQTKLDTWHINCKLKKKSEKSFSNKKNLKTIFQFFFSKKIEKLKKNFGGKFFFFKKKIVERKWKKNSSKIFFQ